MAQVKKTTILKVKPKETDEFISFSQKLLEFGQKNLTYILCGLALVLIAGAFWGYLQKRQADPPGTGGGIISGRRQSEKNRHPLDAQGAADHHPGLPRHRRCFGIPPADR